MVESLQENLEGRLRIGDVDVDAEIVFINKASIEQNKQKSIESLVFSIQYRCEDPPHWYHACHRRTVHGPRTFLLALRDDFSGFLRLLVLLAFFSILEVML